MSGLDLGIDLDDFTRLHAALQRMGLSSQNIRECQAAARMDAAAYAQRPPSAGSGQPASTAATSASELWDASLSRVLPQIEAGSSAPPAWQASIDRLRDAGEV